METLRGSLGSLGFDGVRTYIQSGNIAFKSSKHAPPDLARIIGKKILDDFGLEVPVLVRTAEELGEVLKANPLLRRPGIDESKLHVTFLSDPPTREAEAILKPLAARSELFAVGGREIYLYCPAGYGVTKLSNAAIEHKLSVRATTRNWKTVNVLKAMAGS